VFSGVLEPGTFRLLIQHSTTGPPGHVMNEYFMNSQFALIHIYTRSDGFRFSQGFSAVRDTPDTKVNMYSPGPSKNIELAIIKY